MRNRIVTAAVCLTITTGCARPGRLPAPSPAASSPAAEWIAHAALYEVNVRDFSPAGNFQGVIAGLDRIRATGANVVWLMPIHPIGVLHRKGRVGSPYSVRDYLAVNPDYGTKADFRALVDSVHARGMKLIMDWVPNHTAWDNVWVKQHPDFYTRDAHGHMVVALDNDGKPTDWTDVADLNYANPELRRTMIADMLYWLDNFGIDGFRVDVAWGVPDDFWRQAIPALRAGRPPILLLAEASELKMHRLGFDLTYPWDSYNKLKAVWKGEPASDFVAHELADLRAMPPGGRRLRFTTNHDETANDNPPVILFGGPAGARAAFVATALLPGVPLLYDGQEVESPQKLQVLGRQAIDWNQPHAAAALAFYRRVIELERTNPAFAGNDLRPVRTDADADVIAYRRGEAVVLVNARPRPVRVTVRGLDLTGARDLLGGALQRGDSLQLAPYGAVVLEPVRPLAGAPSAASSRVRRPAGAALPPGCATRPVAAATPSPGYDACRPPAPEASPLR